MEIQVIVANIVKQADAESVVNSANANLRLGSGVAGAIHTAAGDELEHYCQQLAPLALGKAVITPGFNLPNKYVIHVRAAHYLHDDDPEAHLELAYRSALTIAASHNIQSVAIPAMGVGVFKFPLHLAAEITAKVLLSHEWDSTSLKWVRLCVSDEHIKSAYLNALS